MCECFFDYQSLDYDSKSRESMYKKKKKSKTIIYRKHLCPPAKENYSLYENVQDFPQGSKSTNCYFHNVQTYYGVWRLSSQVFCT